MINVISCNSLLTYLRALIHKVRLFATHVASVNSKTPLNYLGCLTFLVTPGKSIYAKSKMHNQMIIA